MDTATTTRKKITSEVLTVLFVDLVEYTKTTARLTREHFDQLLNVFEEIPLPLIDKYGGTVVKKIGDAYMVTFRSPTDAVLCGIALQQAFRRYNVKNKLQHPLRIRVAIHTGEVLHRGGDVYGDAVNTSARIEEFAQPGQVVFSDAVFSAMNKNEVPCVHLGVKEFKGVSHPLRLWRVRTRADEIARRKEAFKRFIQQIAVLGFVIVILIILLRVLWLNWSATHVEQAALDNLSALAQTI
jgi:class 3 adenylate cyclase